MLEQLTIKCDCSEHIPPDEYENHLSRCSNVIFTCPHKTCREKVCHSLFFFEIYGLFRIE